MVGADTLSYNVPQSTHWHRDGKLSEDLAKIVRNLKKGRVQLFYEVNVPIHSVYGMCAQDVNRCVWHARTLGWLAFTTELCRQLEQEKTLDETASRHARHVIGVLR